MTPAARFQAAIEVLDSVLGTAGLPADRIVEDYFRQRRYAGSKDRAAINARLYRIFRSFHRLSWLLAQSDVKPSGRLLALADALSQGEMRLEDAQGLCDGGRFSPEPLSSDEMDVCRRLRPGTHDCAAMPEDVRLECPAWAAAGLRQSLQEGFAPEMRATLEPARLALRVNSLKSSRDEALAVLAADGIAAQAGKFSPSAIVLEGRPALSAHPLYRDGKVEIQDEGSQLIADLCQPRPGWQVMDFCAGAGGKTLALAAMMNNKGQIVAADVSSARLEKSKKRFARAGVSNIVLRPLSSEQDKWIKRNPGRFDLVLVDAPCTGTGTWRREPDKRWRQVGPALPELLSLQAAILASAARLVKPGGRLVYATCSLLDEENQGQIDVFLKNHGSFALQDARAVLPYVPLSGPCLKLWTHVHGTDGFFAALMVRNPAG